MPAADTSVPSMPSLLRKIAFTSWDALQNRSELFLVELQQEKNRAVETVIWAGAVCFLGILFFGVLTATIIFVVPRDYRVYAAGGFSLLYLIATVLCFLNLRALLKNAETPFADSIAEVKKDREWLESLK